MIKKKLDVSISNSSLKIFKRVLNAYVMNIQLQHIGESEWEIMVVEVNGGEPIEIPTMDEINHPLYICSKVPNFTETEYIQFATGYDNTNYPDGFSVVLPSDTKCIIFNRKYNGQSVNYAPKVIKIGENYVDLP